VCQVAVTAGVVMLLFVVYQVWVTDWFSDNAQDKIAHDLRQQWASPTTGRAAPDFGNAFAFLHIPRFGDDYQQAVVEGTEPEELEEAPGHFVDTAMPGEPGNFAVAGHRVGKGSPFIDLDRLRDGDAIVVETADTWFVYRVTTVSVTAPTDAGVLDAVPGHPGVAPDRAVLTLVTCTPKFTDHQRLVVHAELDSSVAKADEPDGPPALREVT
jgi:sortase A